MPVAKPSQPEMWQLSGSAEACNQTLAKTNKFQLIKQEQLVGHAHWQQLAAEHKERTENYGGRKILPRGTLAQKSRVSPPPLCYKTASSNENEEGYWESGHPCMLGVLAPLKPANSEYAGPFTVPI
eukprot:1151817-Pelagomonas_calceolata.AAC.4